MATDYQGDGAGGFYNPEPVPWPIRPGYQHFVNHTNGILSIQILDSIQNLLTLTPSLHGENLALAGEEVVWLRRLTSGTPCPNFNTFDDQCAVSKCMLCFGTGIYQGFDQPITLRMSFIPGRADILIEQAGLTVTQRPMAWTIVTDPNMEERDMLITYTNERYLIHSAEAVEKQGRKMYQALTLSRIDKTDVLYYVPVPTIYGEALTDFTASITITPPIAAGGNMPGANFPATIFIKNFYFDYSDGITPLDFGADSS
jgi:hypothetical protein